MSFLHVIPPDFILAARLKLLAQTNLTKVLQDYVLPFYLSEVLNSIGGAVLAISPTVALFVLLSADRTLESNEVGTKVHISL